MTAAEAAEYIGEYVAYDLGGMWEQGGVLGSVIDGVDCFVNFGYFEVPAEIDMLSLIRLGDLDIELMKTWTEATK